MISEWLANNTGIADILASLHATEAEKHLALVPLAKLLRRHEKSRARQPKSQTVAKVRELAQKGKTASEIAVAVGVSVTRVGQIAHRYGLTIAKPTRSHPLRACECCGEPVAKPSHRYCGTECRNKRRSQLSAEQAAILTAEQVREVRAARKRGETYRVIGKRYGVSLRTIASICARHTWRHVE